MAGMTVAELVARLRADTSSFTRGMSSAERSLSSFEGRANSISSSVMRLGSQMAAGFAQVGEGIALASSVAVGSLLKVGVGYQTLLQKTNAGFTTLLKSAEKAQGFTAELMAFGGESPFPKQLFIEGAQQMLGFGIAAKKIVPIFKSIQDAVGGMGADSSQILQFANIFSRIKSRGKATAEELVRFQEAGIDAFAILADQSGVSVNQMRKQIEQGMLGANEAIDMLTKGMGEKFAGGAANLKKTWLGALDRVKGKWRDFGAAIVEPFIGASGGGLAVKWANEIADALKNLTDNVVRPLATKLGEFFEKLDAKIRQLPFEEWLTTGKRLWQEYGGTIKDLLPVIGAVGAAFGKMALGRLPFVSQLAGMIPFFGPVTSGLIALVASNKQLRDQFLAVAKIVQAKLMPVIEALLPVLARAAGEVAAVIVAMAPEIVEELASAFANMVAVAVEMLPILAHLISGAILLATELLPIITGLTAVAAWLAQNKGVALALAAGLAFLAVKTGFMGTKIRELQFAFGSAHPVIYSFFQLLDRNPYAKVAAAVIGLAVVHSDAFGSIVEGVGNVMNAFTKIPGIITGAMNRAYNAITAPVTAIINALNYAFNPFTRHSPSLVDNVIAGTQLIATKYGDMARSIIPKMRQAQSAMAAMNAAAGGMEGGLRNKEMADLSKNLSGVENGAALLRTYNLLTGQIAMLTAELVPLEEAYRRETAKMQAQQKVLDRLNRSYADHQKLVRKTELAIEKAQASVSGITDELSKAQQELSDFLNTPLEGSGAFSDAAFANEQAIAALQFRLNKLQMSDGPADEIEALEAKIDKLRKSGDQLRLAEQLTLGPQRRELEKLGQTTEEMSFGDIVAGVKETSQTIRDLTDKLIPAEGELSSLQATLDAQEAVSQSFEAGIEASTLSLEAQQQVMEDLGSTIGGLTSILDDFGQRQAQIVSDAASRFQQIKDAADAAAGDSGADSNEDYAPVVTPAVTGNLGGLFNGLEDSLLEDFDLDAVTSKVQDFADKVGGTFKTLSTIALSALGVKGVMGIIKQVGGTGAVVSKIAGVIAGGLSGIVDKVAIGAYNLTGYLSKIAPVAGPVGLAIAGVGAALFYLNDKQNEARDGLKLFYGSLDSSGSMAGAVKNMGDLNAELSTVNQDRAKGWTSVFEEAGNAVGVLGGNSYEARNQAGELKSTISDLNSEFDAIISTADRAAGQFGMTRDQVIALGDSLGLDFVNKADESIKAIGDAREIFYGMGYSAEDAAKLTGEAFQKIVGDAKKFRDNMDETISASTNLVQLFGGQTDLTEQQMRDELKKMGSSAEEFAANMEIIVAAGPGSGITYAMLQEMALAGPQSYALARSLAESIRNGHIDEVTASTGRITNAYNRVGELIAFSQSWFNSGTHAGQGTINGLLRQLQNPQNVKALQDNYAGLGYMGAAAQQRAYDQAMKNWTPAMVGGPATGGQGFLGVLAGLAGAPGGRDNNPATPLAKGGLITSTTFAMMGESGPELVLPLNDMKRTMALLQESGLMDTLGAKFASGMSGLTGVSPTAIDMGRSTGMAGGSGGDGGSITIHEGDTILRVEGSVTSEGQLIEKIHAGLVQKGKRNGSVPFERVGV